MASWRRSCAAACLAGFALALPGCATFHAPQTEALLARPPSDLPQHVELAGTPFFAQTALQCGPAALATAMQAAGRPVTPEALSGEVFVPERGGSLQIEMLAAPRRHGLVSTRIEPDMSSLLHETAAGHPVVVLLNLGLAIYPVWHYAVVIGYDLPNRDVLMRSGTTRLMRMPLSTFEHTWARSERWAFVALPPDALPVSALEADITQARVDFERVASPADSEAAYRSALQRYPDNLTLALGLGNAQYKAGRLADAAGTFEQLAHEHDSAAAWNNLASVRLQLGQREAAREAARAAVARAQAAEPQWLAAARATLNEVERAGP